MTEQELQHETQKILREAGVKQDARPAIEAIVAVIAKQFKAVNMSITEWRNRIKKLELKMGKLDVETERRFLLLAKVEKKVQERINRLITMESKFKKHLDELKKATEKLEKQNADAETE